MVFLAGNNCSGRSFQPLLDWVAGSEAVADDYTVYAFDYRGSGGSSYEQPIGSLDDFARDFTDVIAGVPALAEGGIILVGHSMGFGVAQRMVDLDPSKYRGVVSLAGIGTRGVRVLFAGATTGTDPISGKTYAGGDWSDSLEAIVFHQRSWFGENRTADRVATVWNMVVFNDILKVDPTNGRATQPAYLDDPGYQNAIDDVLSIRYMPQSLDASHRFNGTAQTLSHTNQDGTVVSIPGEDRLSSFAGMPVLLVKATTNRATWRGDLVIDDSITQNTKYDLKTAGARVTALLLDSDRGYDHGFPIHHPAETMRLVSAFAESLGEPTRESLDAVFGAGTYEVYSDEETSWEREAYGGF